MSDPHLDRCEQALRMLCDTRAQRDCHGPPFLACGDAIKSIAEHVAQYVRHRGGERIANIEKMIAQMERGA